MHEQGRDWPRLAASLAVVVLMFAVVIYGAVTSSGQSERFTGAKPGVSQECDQVVEGVGTAEEVVVLQADEKFTSVAVVVSEKQYDAVADQLKATDNLYSMQPGMSAAYCQVRPILAPQQRAEVNRLEHFSVSRSRFYFTTANPLSGADVP